MIPKKIHFIWIGSELPRWVNSLIIKRWKKLNPDFQIVVHGEELLETCSSEYRKMFDKLEDVSSKSDILRLAVLKKEGGWYFDCDFVPLRPMSELYEAYDMSKNCFLTKQWDVGVKRIANGIIGISQDAEAWDEIDKAFEETARGELVRTSFGPLLTTRVVTRTPHVTIGQVKDFYPIRFQADTWPYLSRFVKSNYSDAEKKIVFKDLNPFMFHLWLGGKKYKQPELDKLLNREPSAVTRGKSLSLQVVCILHKESEFTNEHVNKLYKKVGECLGINHEFICLTNNSNGIRCKTIPLLYKWPRQWSKIELFKPGLFKNYARKIYLGLDVEVIGDIDCLASVNCKLAMPEEKSGLDMLIWEGNYSVIYDAFRLENERLINSSSCSDDYIRIHASANFGRPDSIQSLIPGIVPETKPLENDMRIMYPMIGENK